MPLFHGHQKVFIGAAIYSMLTVFIYNYHISNALLYVLAERGSRAEGILTAINYISLKFKLLKALSFILLLTIFSIFAFGQVGKFGEADIAELQMTDCSFEKNASAMILFDVAKVSYDKWKGITMERHRRIKIFNEQGLSYANIKLPYSSDSDVSMIRDIEAVTYNLVGGAPQKTVIDAKQIYSQKIDKESREYIIPFVNVKPGSVIELRYKWKTRYGNNYPSWSFQSDLPTQYSEYDRDFNSYGFNTVANVNRQFEKDTIVTTKEGRRHTWAMKNIPAFKLELYMHSLEDNIQYIAFYPAVTFRRWPTVANKLMEDEDFGKQLDIAIDGEADIIGKAGKLKNDFDKIEYLFNTVKTNMLWNKNDMWYTRDGIKKAWQKKTGNSTEINLILYHLLAKTGFKPSLLVFGKREYGEIKAGDPGYSRLNKTVVQLAVDSTSNLVLDATSKYNSYNSTPYELLGLNMLSINPETKISDIIKLNSNHQSEETTVLSAALQADGKLSGTVEISSSFYKKVNRLMQYDEMGSQKYLDGIKGDKSSLVISKYTRANMQTDTLPLSEHFDFTMKLADVDDDYIYFKPTVLANIGQNPFLSEERLSDIDYVYLNKFTFIGRYTVPKGYKIDVLPKRTTLAMADNSIIFRRIVGEQEGQIVSNYVISFNKARFSRDEYKGLHDFYKKMFELLNEQIVLKKG
ncbi:MAG: hypothetical protein C0154_16915 [Mucilaginibacter sp.]|nr:MAG: hypothetical protein BGO48_14110 [Mucilaginibacter sp. 44-25]PLW88393.1 MAG: hypothetical protein C0154_16915 [Mucilaginibacter sp.]HEK20819.1 DUF3857 domain-containing protein [Bacteroidota bacterium]